MWRSEGTLWESGLSSHHIGPGHKRLHLLNLLTGLRMCISGFSFFPFHPEDRTRAFAHTGQVLCHLRDTFPSHRPSRRSCRAALGEASFRVMEARLCPA